MDESNLCGTTPIADPLAGSAWSRPETVAGFVGSPPNADLLQLAERELRHQGGRTALDIGCGAGRNAIHLARQGWTVIGTDLSLPMLQAASQRGRDGGVGARLATLLAPMEALPLRSRSCHLVVAHGIWNLARSGDEFRRAVGEGARVAAPDASLFVFTFSRNTFEAETRPVDGESFVFTQFSGEPQCFLTAEQLIAELGAAGFVPDPALPLQEFNRRPAGVRVAGSPPVIYQAAFRRRS